MKCEFLSYKRLLPWKFILAKCACMQGIIDDTLALLFTNASVTCITYATWR